MFQILTDFLCENCTPPEKSHHPLSQQPPSKSRGSVKSTFLESWLEVQPPPPPPAPPSRKGRGIHTMDSEHW